MEIELTHDELARALKSAPHETLDEIMREAEARLNAQLSAAIAADQRAMTFLGFLLTLVAFAVGASLAAINADTPSIFVAVVAAIAAAGFIGAAIFSYVATRPITFEFVGNDPGQWTEDIADSVSLHDAKAMQCAFYDQMLKDNRRAMLNASRALRKSSVIAGLTVIACILVIVVKSIS